MATSNGKRLSHHERRLHAGRGLRLHTGRRLDLELRLHTRGGLDLELRLHARGGLDLELRLHTGRRLKLLGFDWTEVSDRNNRDF